MSSQAISQNESSLIGNPSNPVATSTGQIVIREFGPARPLPLANTAALASLVQEFEAEPEMAGHLVEARRSLATEMYTDEPETFSALRLGVGLSQAQLAVRANTTQPYIARIEGGQLDPSTDMISRIAKALDLPEDKTFRAIRNQRATRG